MKETALMNPHVTIIYIDPYGEEFIFPRKVSNFPDEPKYAKPHPSSTNIGDLQDLLSKSEHLSLTSFLQDNFVRMSYNTAKDVVDLAERDLQDKLNFLILENGYINKVEKKKEAIYFIRYEKRVYGRSDRPRDKLIVYKVDRDDLKEKYWKSITDYDEYNKELINLQEDPLDPGGYFISNGTERVLITVEDLAPNRVLVETTRKYGNAVEVAKVFSQREGYRALTVVEKKKDGMLMVSLPTTYGQIPL
ncbi:MAG: hypothetical protein P8Y70_18790, partial [Candidatus Lokiarchaeota archaeon]